MELRRKRKSSDLGNSIQRYKDSSWKPREKKLLLDALQSSQSREFVDVENSTQAPYDLVELQRRLPNRSRGEIKAYIDECVAAHHQSRLEKAKDFKETNIKGWIDCCAANSDDRVCCSESGDGTLKHISPALATASIFKHRESEAEGVDGRDTEVHAVNSFVEQVLCGLDPPCEDALTEFEAYVLVHALHELEQKVARADTIQQERHFHNQCQLATAEVRSDAEHGVTTVNDSKFLNPLSLSKRDTGFVYFSKNKVVD